MRVCLRRILVGLWLVLATAAIASACGGSGGGPQPIATIKAPDYHSLAVSPADPNLVLFGHHFGLQRSTDGGRTWSAVPGVQGDAMNLRFDPNSPATVYLAGHEVFLKSLDGGRTWQQVQANLPGLDLHAFAVHPARSGIVYALAVGFGLFKSENGGVTWTVVNDNISDSTVALVVDEGEPETLYIAVFGGGVGKSVDGGKSWLAATQGLSSVNIFALAMDPATDTLYAGTDQGLFKSADGTRTWLRLPSFRGEVVAIALDPRRPETVYVLNSKGQLFVSRDGGLSW